MCAASPAPRAAPLYYSSDSSSRLAFGLLLPAPRARPVAAAVPCAQRRESHSHTPRKEGRPAITLTSAALRQAKPAIITRLDGYPAARQVGDSARLDQNKQGNRQDVAQAWPACRVRPRLLHSSVFTLPIPFSLPAAQLQTCRPAGVCHFPRDSLVAGRSTPRPGRGGGEHKTPRGQRRRRPASQHSTGAPAARDGLPHGLDVLTYDDPGRTSQAIDSRCNEVRPKHAEARSPPSPPLAVRSEAEQGGAVQGQPRSAAHTCAPALHRGALFCRHRRSCSQGYLYG